MHIDLNCDVGESFGTYLLGNDADLLRYVSSANIACGWHAGDPATMRRTVRLAMQHGVAIGAHPGLPDLAGFGDSVPDPPGTWERHVEAIDRFRRELGIERCALIVHDWGRPDRPALGV